MNLLAMFQTMINEILWDLINMGKVASFIDNMIIETEGKERHNELVEEIVRRLAENNLYIKSEKCKWKMREVGFLGSNKTRGYKDGGRKGEGSTRLNDTQVY